ncbi:MAG: FCD domain-containing protein [Thermomicrobiales bacterium]|nr:FCD domain-containing protein [Thermomicrobiales bacterium]
MIARILDASASCCWDDDESSAASSLDFHFAVAVASHSPLLIAVMRLLLDPSRDQLEIMLSGLTRSSGISERLRDEHLEIANLVIAGESDAASVAMSQHFDHLIEQSGTYLPHQV